MNSTGLITFGAAQSALFLDYLDVSVFLQIKEYDATMGQSLHDLFQTGLLQLDMD